MRVLSCLVRTECPRRGHCTRSSVDNALFRCNNGAFTPTTRKKRHRRLVTKNSSGAGARSAGSVSPADMFSEPIEPRQPMRPEPSLHNADFAPTTATARTFSSWDLASLWVGLIVSVPTYSLASSLVELGMSWWQGILNIFLANLLVLVPLVLAAHPGTKYGVPFPVLSRASFGVHGAHIPSVLRALVACGWFGIQTWVGGSSMHTLIAKLAPGVVSPEPLAWLGIRASEFLCFLAFWALQVAIVWEGVECIRVMEKYAAPVLLALSAALLWWAWSTAGGVGPMLSAPSQFATGAPMAGQFWATFVPALTANVGYWATLALNIPDFSRYARSQRDQLLGQALGLPVVMAVFSFVGLAVTSATVTIFGSAISDPLEVVSRMAGLAPLAASLVGLMLATLSTNIAANVVAPANAFVNLNPQRVSFRVGGLLTALIGAAICPWNLISGTQGYIFTWLIGYSALLGPVGGILLADYFLIRQRTLDVDALYSLDPSAPYWYTGGINPAALTALLVGVAPSIPGFLSTVGLLPAVPSFFSIVYNCSWFVGSSVACLVYLGLMRGSAYDGAHKHAT